MEKGMPNADDMLNACLEVTMYKENNWVKPVTSENGEVLGYWLAKQAEPVDEAGFLKMLAVSEQQESAHLAISSGYYRKVENTYDNDGGKFVMFWDHKAPGEF